jgi:hypothetical protein
VEDVCVEHDAPLDCRHGCDHAKGHVCGDGARVVIERPPPDAVVDLFDALKAVLAQPKKRARRG